MKFVPIYVNPNESEDDNHLLSHVEEIADGKPCECADVDTTSSGIIVVSEIDPMKEVNFNPDKPEDSAGYDIRGPYL